MTPITIALCASAVLFTMGAVGTMTRRDLLRVLISVSIMLGSITLLIVALADAMGTATGGISTTSQTLILFVWTVEIVEIVIAVTLFACLARSGAPHLSDLRNLRW